MQKFTVFDAIADDRRFCGQVQRESDQKFSLGANLKAEIIGAAIISNAFDDFSLLVHLDREHALIAALILHFSNGISKAEINFFNPSFQKIGYPDQNRCGNAALAQILNQFQQVCRLRLWPVRMT